MRKDRKEEREDRKEGKAEVGGQKVRRSEGEKV
jgi:hypothetical protein